MKRLGFGKFLSLVSECFYNETQQKQLNNIRGQKGCLCTFALQKGTLRKERMEILKTITHRFSNK